MKTNLLRLVAVTTLLFGCNGVTLADTVNFNPSPSLVTPGDTFNVDIIGTGFTELAGGVLELGFDSTLLQINSVSIDPYFDFLPDGGGPASGDIWPGIGFDTFVNDPATGDFTIATINLTAKAGGSSSLVILNTSKLFSTTALLDPILITGTVTAVPVPAAVWLFGTGLLGLIGVARKKVS